MVNVLSKIGSDLEIPKRKQIGGPLLDLNYQKKYNDNKTNLLKGADVFGLSFLGDGATVKRMPLMNILAACADSSHHCPNSRLNQSFAAGGKERCFIYCGDV